MAKYFNIRTNQKRSKSEGGLTEIEVSIYSNPDMDGNPFVMDLTNKEALLLLAKLYLAIVENEIFTLEKL